MERTDPDPAGPHPADAIDSTVQWASSKATAAPQARSLDPATEARQLRNRRRGDFIAFGFLTFLVVMGVLAVVAAFACGMRNEGISLLAIGAMALALPARAVFVHVRRKIRTGHWRMDDPERQEFYNRIAARPMSKVLSWSLAVLQLVTTGIALAALVVNLRHKRLDGIGLLLFSSLVVVNVAAVVVSLSKRREMPAAS